jgi:AhpD family alkylhydroperoxidase
MNRIESAKVYEIQPAILRCLGGLGEAAEGSGLEPALLELVRLRASQINGCAYCVDMHSRDARGRGERQSRLDLVAVWREAPCFSPRERAALAWAEAQTRIAEAGVPDAVYAEARAHFSEAELVNLTAAVVTINAWNRICVTFRFPPETAA